MAVWSPAAAPIYQEISQTLTEGSGFLEISKVQWDLAWGTREISGPAKENCVP